LFVLLVCVGKGPIAVIAKANVEGKKVTGGVQAGFVQFFILEKVSMIVFSLF
jgi:hypothetical protein